VIDPADILEKHIGHLKLRAQDREDVEATFHRLVELGAEAAQGADVAAELEQIDAQIALYKSGALSSAQAALRAAAIEYATAAGEILVGVIRRAASGLI